MAYAPDKDIPYHGPKDGNGGKKKGGNALKIGFMPGQIAGIADDMSDGYGGKDAKWKNYLRDVYSPIKMPNFNFGGRGGNGNGNGGKDDPTGTGPGTNPDKPDPGFDTSRPDHRMGQMQMPYGAQPGAQMMQQPVQGLLNVGPMGQMTPPTMGLLGQPQQMQQRKPQAGILPPEIQAMLTQRR